MSADRYLKVILTVIALELGWIALKDTAVPVSAQRGQQTEPTPVVIRGIDLPCTGPASYVELQRGVPARCDHAGEPVPAGHRRPAASG